MVTLNYIKVKVSTMVCRYTNKHMPPFVLKFQIGTIIPFNKLIKSKYIVLLLVELKYH